MTAIEKSKLLRDTRKRLGWSQAQLARALGLDRSYLSQLENFRKYRRPVDDFYLERLQVLEREQSAAPAPAAAVLSEALAGQAAPGEGACLEYFKEFLERCRGEPARLGWTWIELKERFPLDRWEKHR